MSAFWMRAMLIIALTTMAASPAAAGTVSPVRTASSSVVSVPKDRVLTLRVKLAQGGTSDPLGHLRASGRVDAAACLFSSRGAPDACAILSAILSGRTGPITVTPHPLKAGDYTLVMTARAPTTIDLGGGLRVLGRGVAGHRLQIFTADLLGTPVGGVAQQSVDASPGFLVQGVGWFGHASVAAGRSGWCIGPASKARCDLSDLTQGFLVDREFAAGGVVTLSYGNCPAGPSEARENLATLDQLDLASGFLLMAA